jgi:hypothetical protein
MSNSTTAGKGLKSVHVTWQSAASQWHVKEGGSTTVLHRSDTKPPAIAYGRSYAKSIKGELFIHNMDGTIAERESYGNDPFPPRG